jgi:osmotically-inducible protein OsmY
VLARLTAAFGDASAIEIRVDGNVVTLSGTVGDERTRDRAVKESYGVEGIERVENRLRITAPPANPRGM